MWETAFSAAAAAAAAGEEAVLPASDPFGATAAEAAALPPWQAKGLAWEVEVLPWRAKAPEPVAHCW